MSLTTSVTGGFVGSEATEKCVHVDALDNYLFFNRFDNVCFAIFSVAKDDSLFKAS